MTQTTSKRLTIAMFAVLAAIIVGLAATLIVFAATGQNISSSINVSYTAEGIYGKASATYKVGENGTETAMKNGTQTEIIFNGGVSGNSVLNPENITLTSADSYVVFKYTFTNEMEKAYYAELNYTDLNDDDKNITTTYSTDGETYVESQDTVTIPASETNTDGTASYYIKVAVANKAKDATFTGSFSWELDAIAPVEVVAEYNENYGAIITDIINVDPNVTSIKIPSKVIINGQLYEANTLGGPANFVGSSLFSEYKNLQTIVLPNTMYQFIGKVFADCKKIKSIVIPYVGEKVVAIGPEAFSGCDSLETIEITNNKIYFPDTGSGSGYNSRTFDGCTSLKEIIISKEYTGSELNGDKLSTYNLEYFGLPSTQEVKITRK